MKIQRSVEIAVAPERVWPFLIDPQKIMKWFTFLKRFEYTTAKVSGNGTTFFYEERSGPQTMKLNYEVTNWIDNSTLAFKLTKGPLRRDDQIWSLEPTATGTRFTMTEEVEMPWGSIGRVLDRFLSGMITKNMEKILGNLQKQAEA